MHAFYSYTGTRLLASTDPSRHDSAPFVLVGERTYRRARRARGGPCTTPKDRARRVRDVGIDGGTCRRLWPTTRRSGKSKGPRPYSLFVLYPMVCYLIVPSSVFRTKSNQRWMKLRTTVQLSSAIQKKPPLKREDSFLKRFSTRQIPETQETVEDTGSEGAAGEQRSTNRQRRRKVRAPRTVVNPDENFYFYWLWLITACVLYNLWTLIVRQSFPELQVPVVIQISIHLIRIL
ncbi:hypothetical protein EVAR_64691_1 [Eumeta japonica]|uniref:Uncharacterized protein n=1 Tax=Eumeta variegata TaxID=151549 RepID=A0A4C1ZNG2_EUMVA|nr:hypothetical protein EVAR_64691_1 [Eumeta japonica]